MKRAVLFCVLPVAVGTIALTAILARRPASRGQEAREQVAPQSRTGPVARSQHDAAEVASLRSEILKQIREDPSAPGIRERIRRYLRDERDYRLAQEVIDEYVRNLAVRLRQPRATEQDPAVPAEEEARLVQTLAETEDRVELRTMASRLMLARLSDDAIDRLATMFASTSVSRQIAILTALSGTGGPRFHELLEASIGPASDRRLLEGALVRLPQSLASDPAFATRIAPRLLNIAQDNQIAVTGRERAYRALAHMDELDPGIVQLLRGTALGSKEEWERSAALRALPLGDHGSAEVYVRALNDPSAGVRLEAAQKVAGAFLVRPGRELIPALVQAALDDPDTNIRRESLRALATAVSFKPKMFLEWEGIDVLRRRLEGYAGRGSDDDMRQDVQRIFSSLAEQ